MKPALLLIDLQHDYLTTPGLEPSRGSIEAHAAALLRACRELALPIVHVWTTVSRADDRRMPHWQRTGRWSCESGTPGHAPPAPLRPRPAEPIIHKTFFSAFSNSELEPLLRQRGVDTLILAGVHLHACLRQTALDAYERGFQVCFAEDAVGSDDPVHAAIVRRYLSTRAARFLETSCLLTELREDQPAASGEPRRAVDRAHAAFPAWSRTPPAARCAVLERVASILENDASALADQMAREIGKPVRYGRVEAARSAEMLRAVAVRCRPSADEPLAPGISLRRRPHGVVALVSPWNNPIYIALGKIAPAILCGNTVVWKPSPLAEPLSRRLHEILLSAGCPPGVVCFLPGTRTEAESLMADPGVAAVSLTGSSLAGYSAQEICARRRIPLQAELGGNNAAIVWPDCDLRDAAQKIAEGAFGQAGQRCTANRRAIVHENIYEAFLGLLSSETAAIPSGDPLHPETRLGPLVTAAHATRVSALLERCAAEGHRLVRPASSAPQIAAWHPPVLVCCDDPAAEIVQEETFGPVLVLQRAASWAQAIALCNGVRQGLAAALFSPSAELQRRFLDEAQAGLLKLNQATADAAVDVPFGGWKASGLGPPEHGNFDRDFYLRPQTCYDAS